MEQLKAVSSTGCTGNVLLPKLAPEPGHDFVLGHKKPEMGELKGAELLCAVSHR